MEDDEKDTSGYKNLPIQLPSDTLTDFLGTLCSLFITYVDPDIAGRMVGENYSLILSCHWPGVHESRLPTVSLIINTIIVSIRIGAIGDLADSSRRIQWLWRCCNENIHD
jgi:hypothetical protein